MPLQSKIGACGVSLSGNYRWGYPIISGQENYIPICSFQKRKAIFPRKIGAMSVLLPAERAQDCAGYPATIHSIFYESSLHFLYTTVVFLQFCTSLHNLGYMERNSSIRAKGDIGDILICVVFVYICLRFLLPDILRFSLRFCKYLLLLFVLLFYCSNH